MSKYLEPVENKKSFTINACTVVAVAVTFLNVYTTQTLVSDIWSGLSDLLVVLTLAGLGLLSHNQFVRWVPNFPKFNIVEIFSIIVMIICVSALAWTYLTADLWSDAVYHASLASRPAQLLIFKASAQYPEFWNIIEDLPASLLVQLVHLFFVLILLMGFVLIPLFGKIGRTATVLCWILTFVFLRVLMSDDLGIIHNTNGFPVYFAGNAAEDTHPHLRFLPLVFSSSIFGAQPLGFRIAGFLSLIAMGLILYLALRSRLGSIPSLLVIVSFITIPGLLQTSALVESSIWMAVCGGLLFAVAALTVQNLTTPNLLVFGLVAAFAAWTRAPGFLVLIPFGILFLQRLISKDFKQVEAIWFACMLGLVLFAAYSFIFGGSPALTKDTSMLDQLVYALTNSIPYVALITVMGLIPVLFIGISFAQVSAKGVLLTAGIIGFIILAFVVYYGPTKEGLWGNPRYQAEIATPIIAAGIISFASIINLRRKIYIYVLGKRVVLAQPLYLGVVLVPIIILIASNVFTFTNVKNVTKQFLLHPVDGRTTAADAHYPLKQAFLTATQSVNAEEIYLIGTLYGGFQGVLLGMSAKEYIAFSHVNIYHRKGFMTDLDAVVSDERINAILVETKSAHHSNAVDFFKQKNWNSKIVAHPNSGFETAVYFRPN